MKIKTSRILARFPTTLEMFPLKMRRCSHGITWRHLTIIETNIRIIDTLNLIKYYINNDDQFTKKAAILQDNFLDLANLVSITTWYTFDSQFYQQTDSCAMGRPTSSRLMSIRHIYGTKPSKSVISICWSCLFHSSTSAVGKPFPPYRWSSSKY